MTSNEQQWRLWPALEQIGRGRRWRLQCAQASWGGIDGGDGSGWGETGAGFDAASRRRAEALYLGDEDDPSEALIWHGSDDVHLAALCRPLPAGDGSARILLERRVLEFRNPRRLPAALLAFAMLPRVEALDDGFGYTESATLFIDELAMAERIGSGCRELARALDSAALTKVYAGLLANQHYIVLPKPQVPLSALAFAALLLPLSRDLADRISMLSRLPSRNIDSERLAGADGRSTVRWHLLGLGNCPPDRLPSPTGVPDDTNHRLAAALAHAIAGNDPTAVSKPPPVLPTPAEQPVQSGSTTRPLERIRSWFDSKQEPARASTSRPARPTLAADASAATQIPTLESPAAPASERPAATDSRQFRIWGASSSGKTVYLAHLFLKHRHGGEPRWRISLPHGADTDHHADRLNEFLQRNRFPEPTAKDSWQRFDYRLTDEQSGLQATISMEDRPGAEFEAFDVETARRLATADGLMLLLDPNRKGGQQDAEVERALMRIQQMRADDGKDPRPLAVCVSKSDELIHSVEEYRRALDEPGGFLADVIGRTIADAIRHHFSSYRIFALSAVGLRIVHGAIEPGVFYDENLEPRPNILAVPINLIEPLVWLLENQKQ